MPRQSAASGHSPLSLPVLSLPVLSLPALLLLGCDLGKGPAPSADDESTVSSGVDTNDTDGDTDPPDYDPASGLVGSEGGTVASSDGHLFVVVPPGTFEDDREVVIRTFDASDDEAARVETQLPWVWHVSVDGETVVDDELQMVLRVTEAERRAHATAPATEGRLPLVSFVGEADFPFLADTRVTAVEGEDHTVEATTETTQLGPVVVFDLHAEGLLTAGPDADAGAERTSLVLQVGQSAPVTATLVSLLTETDPGRALMLQGARDVVSSDPSVVAVAGESTLSGASGSTVFFTMPGTRIRSGSTQLTCLQEGTATVTADVEVAVDGPASAVGPHDHDAPPAGHREVPSNLGLTTAVLTIDVECIRPTAFFVDIDVGTDRLVPDADATTPSVGVLGSSGLLFLDLADGSIRDTLSGVDPDPERVDVVAGLGVLSVGDDGLPSLFATDGTVSTSTASASGFVPRALRAAPFGGTSDAGVVGIVGDADTPGSSAVRLFQFVLDGTGPEASSAVFTVPYEVHDFGVMGGLSTLPGATQDPVGLVAVDAVGTVLHIAPDGTASVVDGAPSVGTCSDPGDCRVGVGADGSVTVVGPDTAIDLYWARPAFGPVVTFTQPSPGGAVQRPFAVGGSEVLVIEGTALTALQRVGGRSAPLVTALDPGPGGYLQAVPSLGTEGDPQLHRVVVDLGGTASVVPGPAVVPADCPDSADALRHGWVSGFASHPGHRLSLGGPGELVRTSLVVPECGGEAPELRVEARTEFDGEVRMWFSNYGDPTDPGEVSRDSLYLSIPTRAGETATGGDAAEDPIELGDGEQIVQLGVRDLGGVAAFAPTTCGPSYSVVARAFCPSVLNDPYEDNDDLYSPASLDLDDPDGDEIYTHDLDDGGIEAGDPDWFVIIVGDGCETSVSATPTADGAAPGELSLQVVEGLTSESVATGTVQGDAMVATFVASGAGGPTVGTGAFLVGLETSGLPTGYALSVVSECGPPVCIEEADEDNDTEGSATWMGAKYANSTWARTQSTRAGDDDFYAVNIETFACAPLDWTFDVAMSHADGSQLDLLVYDEYGTTVTTQSFTGSGTHTVPAAIPAYSNRDYVVQWSTASGCFDYTVDYTLGGCP